MIFRTPKVGYVNNPWGSIFGNFLASDLLAPFFFAPKLGGFYPPKMEKNQKGVFLVLNL